MNKMGPSTEPCGTPYELVNGCLNCICGSRHYLYSQ